MRWFASVALLALTIPASASAVELSELLAQMQLLQAQILSLQNSTTPSPAPIPVASITNISTNIDTSCDILEVTLKRGTTGIDVTRLQHFLSRDANVYPEAIVSGYYGALTEIAVQRWQAKFGIVFSGTPATTGFGSVGPRTLAAMRAQWCLQSNIAPSPFTAPPPTTPSPTPPVSITPTPVAIKPPTPPPPPVVTQPHIMFTSPVASTTGRAGGFITATWKTDTTPVGATVAISLKTKEGVPLGIIKSGLSANGSYFWTIPAPPKTVTSVCTSDPITCLNEVAQSQPGCTTLCTVANGLYVFYAQLIYGTTELAHAQSRIFSIGGVGLSSVDLSNLGTVWNFSSTSTATATSSFMQNQYDLSGGNTTQPTQQTCLYSGVPYTEGITLTITCADVTAPKLSCASFGGMQLTCKAGKWVDSSGVAQTVRNVTEVNTVGACITPWNAMLVANGNSVPREPFFTNGAYATSSAPLIMKCSSGSWQTCDTVGDKCH